MAKGKPSCSTRGGLGDRMAIPHKDMVCVCVRACVRACVRMCVCVWQKGKPSCPTGRGGATGSPSSLARTHSWKTTTPQEGYPVPQGGRGEYTMTSITYSSTRVYDRIYTMGGEGGERMERRLNLAGEHVRRENAIHTQTRGLCVCVVVCMCLSAKGKTILFHRRGVGR